MAHETQNGSKLPNKEKGTKAEMFVYFKMDVASAITQQVH